MIDLLIDVMIDYVINNNHTMHLSIFFVVFIILSQAHQFRDVMYDAYRQKMANGDYVFITIELFPSAHWGHYTKFTDQSYSKYIIAITQLINNE